MTNNPVLHNDSERAKWYTHRVSTTDGVFDIYLDDDRLHAKEKAHVIQVIQEIDAITGIPINITDTQTENTDLVVGHTDQGQLFDVGLEAYDDANGLAFLHSDGDAHSTWRDADYITRFVWKRDKSGKIKKDKHGKFKSKEVLSDYGKYVIAHEILHNFGLEHPHDDGYAKGYTTDDTLMSYNWEGEYNGLGILDQQALQHVWGTEI